MDLSGDGVTHGVAVGDGEGCVRNVGGVNHCAGQFFREGHGDAAGTGAYVGDLQALAGESLFATGAKFADSEAVQRDFDDMFRFRSRDQDVRSDFKFETPEFLLAGEVLSGLTGRPAGNELQKTMGVLWGNFFFRMRVDPGAIPAEDVKQQKLRGERVRWNVRGAQLSKALFQCAAKVH